ncbi:MAG: MATE family efflux transporter [Oscillospiraceae bacterium]|nr:MATE family efflux transporter [Oscillospiraceae bacterium]
MRKNKIAKDFRRYVSLSVLGMVCLSAYILADTYFISVALGADGLTALNISVSIFGVLFGTGLMIGIGGATQYSIQKGKNKTSDANSVFTHAIIVGLFVSIIFSIIGIFFARPLAAILGAADAILPMAEDYIRIILSFTPVIILSGILTAFIRNDSNPKLAMAGMVTGSLSNIVLDWIFLFPLDMGMFGAALATICSMLLGLGVLSLHFITKRNKFNFIKCKIKIKKIANIFLLGSSAFINELSLSIALVTFNLVILNIEGNTGVAAYGVVANIAFIVVSIFTGVAQGIQPLLSKGQGLGDNEMIIQVLKYAIAVVLVMSIVIYAVVYIFSYEIVAIFNYESNETLALLASRGLRIYFIGFIFTGINIIASAFFSAIDKAKTGLMISVLRGCIIIIPMVIVLSAIFDMTGIWLSFVITEMIICVVSLMLLFRKVKSVRSRKVTTLSL